MYCSEVLTLAFSECETFTKEVDTFYFGGQSITLSGGATTIQQCQDACVLNPSCLAIVFNNNAGVNLRCYMHVDATLLVPSNKYQPATGMDFYMVNRCGSKL